MEDKERLMKSVQQQKSKGQQMKEKYRNNIQLTQIIQKKIVEYMREERLQIKEYLHYEQKYNKDNIEMVKQHIANFISQYQSKYILSVRKTVAKAIHHQQIHHFNQHQQDQKQQQYYHQDQQSLVHSQLQGTHLKTHKYEQQIQQLNTQLYQLQSLLDDKETTIITHQQQYNLTIDKLKDQLASQN